MVSPEWSHVLHHTWHTLLHTEFLCKDIDWPPKSPDLTPLDFLIFKGSVLRYTSPENIRHAISKIKTRSRDNVMKNFFESMVYPVSRIVGGIRRHRISYITANTCGNKIRIFFNMFHKWKSKFPAKFHYPHIQKS